MNILPRLTVAAVIERNGRFLVVEERDGDQIVINQPAGHVEPGEDLVSAVIRETYEETSWRFEPTSLLGVYHWSHPQSSKAYLRFCFCGELHDYDAEHPLDPDILRASWLTRAELQQRRRRSPMVIRCIDDYLSGQRYPLSMYRLLDSDAF